MVAMGIGIIRISRMAGQHGVFGLADRVHRASTAQEYLLVQGINNGVIDLGSHEYRAIVRVDPLNFWLLSKEEQDRIQNLWRLFLDSQRDPFTIFSLARRVDVLEPLQDWTTPMPRPDRSPSQVSPMSLPLQSYYAMVAENVAQHVEAVGLLTHTYYLVLHWRPTEKMMGRTSSFQEAATKSLILRQQEVVSQLHRMGLKATPLSTTESLQLLFDVYNRDRARTTQVKDLASSGVATLYTTAPRHASTDESTAES